MALGAYILMISVQQSVEYGVCIFFFYIYQMRVSIAVVLVLLFCIWYVEDG